MLDKKVRLGFVVASIVSLILLVPLSVVARPIAQPLITEEQPALAHCALIPDCELDHIRGRNGNYYFGLDVIVNLTGRGPLFNMIPNPNNTPGTVNTGTGISFSDPSVTYRAGIGSHQLYQMAQVTGDGNAVRGVLNLDVVVPRSLLNGRVSAASIPRTSLTGLTFRY